METATSTCPRKTKIVRKRTGCKCCRRRRVKCDEQKPSCGACTRIGILCEQVSQRYVFHNLTSHEAGDSFGMGGSTVGDSTNRAPCLTTMEMNSQSGSSQAYAISNSNNDRDRETFTEGVSTPTPNGILTPEGPETRIDLYQPQIPPSITPATDATHPVPFYKNIWTLHCLPALHLAFQQIDTLCGSHPLMTDMTVALSACRMSRTTPQKKLIHLSNAPSFRFRPDPDHETLSHYYYGLVMRKMAWWSQQDFKKNTILGLSLLIIFCYLESSMGNFPEFRVHSAGTMDFVRNYGKSLVRDDGLGTDLLAAWVEVEMQNWWRRVYFGTPAFIQNAHSLSAYLDLEDSLRTAGGQRASLLLVLCESHRIGSAAIIACWDDYQVKEQVGAQTTLSIEKYFPELNRQSKKLDEWLKHTPTQDLLPDPWPNYKTQTQPLHFQSHKAAMSFAYYATARVLQSTGPLESLLHKPSTASPNLYNEAEPWISALLRTAAGINWQQCIQLNTYTIGISNLLLACALRSHNLDTGLWIEDWLEKHLQETDLEEGSFPLFQVLQVLRLINSERRRGYDVFSLFQTTDDGGGNGKLGSYYSQRIQALWVYGRCRGTGALRIYRRALEG